MEYLLGQEYSLMPATCELENSEKQHTRELRLKPSPEPTLYSVGG